MVGSGHPFSPHCDDDCDYTDVRILVFLDGAHAVDVDIILEYCDHNPALVEDLEYDVKDPNFRTILEKSGGGPRSWWKRDRAMRTLDLPSHAETLDVVRRALENQRFDVRAGNMTAHVVCLGLTCHFFYSSLNFQFWWIGNIWIQVSWID